jgi:hypothetical protein
VFIFGLVAIAIIFIVARVAQTRGRNQTSKRPPAEPSPDPEQSD